MLVRCTLWTASRRYPAVAMLAPPNLKLAPTRRRFLAVFAVAGGVAAYAAAAIVAPGTFYDPFMDQFGAHTTDLLVVLLAAPVGLAIAQRPQRGVLLLVASVPYWGLDRILPIPSGWKEALALYTLLWTLMSIAGKPRPHHSLPKIVQPFAAYLAVAAASAAIVRGTQAEIGLKIGFFWVMLAVIVWLRPLDAGERDHVVTIMMVNAVITALIGLAQQAVGAGRLVSLGYEYDKTVRFTGHFLRLVLDVPFTVRLRLLPRARDRDRHIGVAPRTAPPAQHSVLRHPADRHGRPALLVRPRRVSRRRIGLVYLAVTRYRWLFMGVPTLVAAPLHSGSVRRRRRWARRASTSARRVGPTTSPPSSIRSVTASVRPARRGRRSTRYSSCARGSYQPDNQYFKTNFELGVLGLFFFVLLMIAAFSTARSAATRLHGRDQALAEGVTAHILGVVVACFVATYFEIFPMDFFFWLLLGIVVTCDRTSS